jgi:hypothetical protein
MKKLIIFGIFFLFALPLTVLGIDCIPGEPNYPDCQDGNGEWGMPLDEDPPKGQSSNPIVPEQVQSKGSVNLYLTEEDLNEGYSDCLRDRNKLYFMVEEGRYYLKIGNIQEGTMTVRLGSRSIDLNLNEELEYDLDSDGDNDILLRFDGDCGFEKGTIFISTLSEIIETEEIQEEIETQSKEVTNNVESTDESTEIESTNALTGFVSAVRDEPGKSSFYGIVGLVVIGLGYFTFKKKMFTKK